MSKLNEALRLIRVLHGTKVKELSESLKISAGYISDIENGNKKPSIDLIEKYAEFFHTFTPLLLEFDGVIVIDIIAHLHKKVKYFL